MHSVRSIPPDCADSALYDKVPREKAIPIQTREEYRAEHSFLFSMGTTALCMFMGWANVSSMTVQRNI